MPFDKAALPGSYLLELSGVPQRIFTLRDPASGRVLDLDFSEPPYCTLWSEGAFICIEPCWGLPDSNPQKPFEEKDGIQRIPPLGTLQAGFSIHAKIENL
jgi:galactose mutarotase-like enzyme